MKTQVGRLAVLVLITLLSGLASIASGETLTRAEEPLMAWEKDVLKVFDRNDYNKVIDMARGQDSDPNGNAPLLIYYGHAQKYYMERDRASAVYYKQQYNAILNRMSGSNLAVLTRLVVMPQVSWNKKINLNFLDAAFKKAGSDAYLGAILFYLESQEPDVSKGAIKGLHAILQRKRDIVMNGGTLSDADQGWMSDLRLLRLLVKKTGGSVSPIAGFMSKVPAFARKKVMGGAAGCLGLIEDPALPILREAASMGNANAAAAIQLIQDARGARLAKYPNSTWYSATSP
ncbi:MAG TPA: hypothetical protein EYP19_10785 [Desulfobacterales bacterium]|nr:hypothetical protein [Desulfobacterales bacterium]